MATRRNLAASTKRQIITEAGDRCAIPTCRQFPVEVAHIIPYRETADDRPENLIALCPTCHARFDSKQIPIDRIRVYKQNTLRNLSRFNGFENAVLDSFVIDSNRQISIGMNMMFLFERLVRDGILQGHETGVRMVVSGFDMSQVVFSLTENGQRYVDLIKQGIEID